jgi:hypothetical protein
MRRLLQNKLCMLSLVACTIAIWIIVLSINAYNRPPFQFLASYVPESKSSRIEGLGNFKSTFYAYSFDGNFSEICSKASAELTAKHYSDATQAGHLQHQRVYRLLSGSSRTQVCIQDRGMLNRLTGLTPIVNANGIGIVEIEIAKFQQRSKWRRWLAERIYRTKQSMRRP